MLSDSDILSIVTDELQQSDTYTDWETPLNYYIGGPNGTEVEGRSSVVSTDVADAIEWIMPQIMKAFTQNNDIVTFDPMGPEDEAQAELESLYVYDVLMKENPGFVIIHNFVKDALLHNNGIIKVYYEQAPAAETNAFTGIPPEQFTAVAREPNVEILNYEQDPITGLISSTIQITTNASRVCLLSIPPEQFRCNTDHDSIDLSTARFTAHVTQKTLSELRKEGYDESLIDQLTESSRSTASDFRFELQNNGTMPGYSSDESQQVVDVSECYMQMDINEDGIAELCKITVAGDSNSPNVILLAEPIDYSPWVATTGILMSHAFKGMSVYDRLKQIQDQKTALLRNILDNLYLQNNQRHLLIEGQANVDDLLLSRPGGVIRVKRPDAVTPLITPQIGNDAYNMMQYLDSIRAGRVGVAPEGEVTPQRIGERVGSEGVAQLLSAKEELVGLIIRVIAETGIKPLCVKIRELLVRHTDAIQNFKYRGQWVQTNPSVWKQRTRTSVRVGTGSGNHTKKLGILLQLRQIQAEMLTQPGQTLVQPANVYAILDDIAKFSELTGASKYFTDPNSPMGQQFAQFIGQQMMQDKQKTDQQNAAIAQSQVQLAQAEIQKAQAQMENVQLRAVVDDLKTQLEKAKELIKLANAEADRELEWYKAKSDAAIKLTEMEFQAKQQQDAQLQQNKETVNDSGTKTSSRNSKVKSSEDSA